MCTIACVYFADQWISETMSQPKITVQISPQSELNGLMA